MSSEPSWICCFHPVGLGLLHCCHCPGRQAPHAAHLCNISLGRAGAQGAAQMCCSCMGRCSLSRVGLGEHFSDSPFERQNLSLRSLGTELKFSASSFRDSPFERQNQRPRSLGTEMNNTKKNGDLELVVHQPDWVLSDHSNRSWNSLCFYPAKRDLFLLNVLGQ